MDYRIFDAILDPVVVLDGDAVILHVNPAAIRWFAIPADFGVIGKSLTDFATFTGSGVFQMSEQLSTLESTPYRTAQFQLASRGLEGVCHIAIQRMPTDDGSPVYALFIRDRGFVQLRYDETQLEEASGSPSPGTGTKKPTEAEMMPEGMPDHSKTQNRILDDATIRSALPAERTAQFHSNVTLMIKELKKPAVAKAILLSDDWIEVVLRGIGIREGYHCTLDIPPTPEFRGFSTNCDVVRSVAYGEDEQVRLAFQNVGALARRNLNEFLDRYALKI